MGAVDELAEVLGRPPLRVDREVVGDRVLLAERPLGHRRPQPQRVDAELLQVLEAVGDLLEPAVAPQLRDRRVDRRAVDPLGVLGHQVDLARAAALDDEVGARAVLASLGVGDREPDEVLAVGRRRAELDDRIVRAVERLPVAELERLRGSPGRRCPPTTRTSPPRRRRARRPRSNRRRASPCRRRTETSIRAVGRAVSRPVSVIGSVSCVSPSGPVQRATTCWSPSATGTVTSKPSALAVVAGIHRLPVDEDLDARALPRPGEVLLPREHVAARRRERDAGCGTRARRRRTHRRLPAPVVTGARREREQRRDDGDGPAEARGRHVFVPYPFTPEPETEIPLTKCFWKTRKTMIIGHGGEHRPGHHEVPQASGCPATNSARPSGKVYRSGSC